MKLVLRLVLIIVLIALCIGCVLFFQNQQTQSSTTSTGQVLLNEVMHSNKGAVSDGRGNYPDWVELHNTSSSAVDISGWGLSDDRLSPAKWVFPAGTSIEANGYLVVFCTGETTEGLYASFKIKSSDDLLLSNSSGHLMDSIELYGVDVNHTIGRAPQTLTWEEMDAPSPGFENSLAGMEAYHKTLTATAEEAEAIGVTINEFMASNASTILAPDGTYADWIELYNATNASVDLSGFGLSDDESRPMRWMFPEGTSIPAKGYLLIFCTGRESQSADGLEVPFRLNSYEETIVFANSQGKILDSYTYSQSQTDESMARVPDGSGDFAVTAQPTPGYPNTDEGYQAFESASWENSGLMISEVLSNNVTALSWEGAYSDWIELYNATAQPIQLGGYGLSDSAKNPAMWTFPEGMEIGPGEYLVVLASGNDVTEAKKKYCETNFGIAAEGDTVFLFDDQGNLLDKLASRGDHADVSCGRDVSSGRRCYYQKPTPGAANGSGSPGITEQPGFSVVPGIYSQPVTVELYHNEQETVYYTTDCTTPTTASTRYDGPITLSENTVIRAVAMRDGYLTGHTVSATFLFENDGVQHSLPVATLVTDPDNLWDPDTGIYAYGDDYDPNLSFGEMLETATYYQAKFTNDDMAWERDGAFAIFDESGRQVFSQNVGVRLAGSFGRGRAQKGFNIIARDIYGSTRMAYPFFDNRDFEEYKAVVLRAGAQDQNRSKIRDELATGLLEGTDVQVLYQAYEPYVLYLNGEYWGVYFLKEKRNRFFIAQHEGTENTTDLNIGYASTRVTYGSNKDWLALMDYIKTHDLSNQANYEYVCSQVDVNSFMDYMICEMYTGNSDYANIQYYKYHDGKWKWIFYDFCWGFSNVDHQTVALRRKSTTAGSDLLNALLENSAWRESFLRRFAELLNTAYTPERVTAQIEELYAAVEPEIAREREKFNQATFMGQAQPKENLGSYDSFVSQIEFLKKFAQQRPEKLKEQLQKEFGLSDAYMQEVFG